MSLIVSNGIVVWTRSNPPKAMLVQRTGQWELPKGRIEDFDASPQAGAIREVREETGLQNEIDPAQLEVLSKESYTFKYKGVPHPKEVTWFLYELREEPVWGEREKLSKQVAFLSEDEATPITKRGSLAPLKKGFAAIEQKLKQ
eukprot:TRINITY_DN1504_c0_g1_i1.p1 TRINITY_DN1504_c0_g1~~TRINITY_DN1504_c0_g1_i1.p1  ORF type:complete len:144 (+),score=8.49 TRINITY_DN1504_c0_g1_i1:61-492(+)